MRVSASESFFRRNISEIRGSQIHCSKSGVRRDPTTNRLLLVEVAEASVIPPYPRILTPAQAGTLRATNGIDIYRYGHCSAIPDPELNRKFRLVFAVADVPYPIIGICTLQHFYLLFDIGN